MNIKLRQLETKDEPFIEEWMNNPQITSQFRFAKHPLNAKQIHHFVVTSFDESNRHYAIVNESDEYLGTVSLKNINLFPKSAEYAIVLRNSVQGLGIAETATDLVLHIAFDELKLDKIYLNVLKTNKRAYEFYERFGFSVDEDYDLLREPKELSGELRYYSMKKTDFSAKKWKILHFKEKGDERGKLVVVENRKTIPFEIRRVFYIYNTSKNAERGCHANRRSEFVMIALRGQVSVILDNGKRQKKILLDSPAKGIYIPRMMWKEMHEFSEDAVLLVLSNELFDANEYIRDYDSYVKEMEELF